MISNHLARIVRTSRKMAPNLLESIDLEPIDLLPHRGCMLLIDQIDGASDDGLMLVALRRVRDDDPVFEGHFPGSPIYPGVLLVETIAQAGACLLSLRRLGPNGLPRALKVRALKVLYSEFTAEVHPKDLLTITVNLTNPGDLLSTFGGRIDVRNKTCATAVVTIHADDHQ